MAADDFGEFLAWTNNATRRSPADVIDADQIARMSDSDFDDALWLALCGHVDDVETLRTLPAGVRMYFATRLVEWEAGSGGFDSAIDIAGEYFEDAWRGIASSTIANRSNCGNACRAQQMTPISLTN